jgi:hypothetical protein
MRIRTPLRSRLAGRALLTSADCASQVEPRSIESDYEQRIVDLELRRTTNTLVAWVGPKTRITLVVPPVAPHITRSEGSEFSHSR